MRVSVNISVGDLLDPAFPATVGSLLAERRLPAEALTIEITETSIIAEFERAQQAVARLRALGVGVSIDDFGAGFTSLAYLNELGVDELKLDRRFIAPLAGGARGRGRRARRERPSHSVTPSACGSSPRGSRTPPHSSCCASSTATSLRAMRSGDRPRPPSSR